VKCVLFAVVFLFLSGFAYAETASFELWPESIFQVRQYRDIEHFRINKTRFSQYLSLQIWEVGEQPQHGFAASMRIDTDIGRDYSPDSPPDPMAYHNIQLLYAYYEGLRLGGVADVTLGRQVISDEFGLYAFDGLRLTLRRDWFFGVSLFVGSEVKGGLTVQERGINLPNSDAYEPDGLVDDDRATGSFGIALFLDGFKNTELRLQYRHLYSGATDAQDLGLTFRQKLFDVWDIYTIDTFSLLFERVTQLRIGTSLDFGFVGGSFEHLSQKPVFDGDSIFNYFATNGQKELAFRLFAKPYKGARLDVGYSRIYQGDARLLLEAEARDQSSRKWLKANNEPFFDDWGTAGNGSNLVTVSGQTKIGRVSDMHLLYRYSDGWGGDYHRFVLGGGSHVWQRYIRLEGDFMGTYFNGLTARDLLEENRNKGFSFGFTVLTEFRLHDDISLKLQSDLYSNRYMDKQFSTFAVLDVRARVMQ